MWKFKKIRHLIEYVLFLSLVGFVRIVGLESSARIINSFLKKTKNFLRFTKVIRSNLKMIYNLPALKEESLVDKIYDNFSRTIAEIALLKGFDLQENLTLVGMEHIEQFRKINKPFILFTGHFANWEVALSILTKIYPEFAVVYRKINNPYIDKFIAKQRRSFGISLIPKGPDGGKILMQAIKERKSLGMLVDQKMNEGIKVPFMGRNAMTSDGLAKIALSFKYPVVPLQIVRVEGTSKFQIIIHKPLDFALSNNKEDNIRQIVLATNNIIEGWINERPDQWLWFHRRWGK